MAVFISRYNNPVEAYLQESSSMVPLTESSYSGPVGPVFMRRVMNKSLKRRRRRKARKSKRRTRKSRRSNRVKKVRRDPRTGRFIKSK